MAEDVHTLVQNANHDQGFVSQLVVNGVRGADEAVVTGRDIGAGPPLLWLKCQLIHGVEQLMKVLVGRRLAPPSDTISPYVVEVVSSRWSEFKYAS